MNILRHWFRLEAAPPALPPKNAALWLSRASEHASLQQSFLTLLSPEELTSAASFRFREDRERYVHAHAVLRILAGRYLGMAPERLAFSRCANGKPFLAPPCRSLAFSLSHADDLAACAFSYDGQLGVDVEKCDADWDFRPLTEQFFHPLERLALADAPSIKAARELFFTCWTRKEAVLKAGGEGLSRQLDSLCVLPPKVLAEIAHSPIVAPYGRSCLQPVPGKDLFFAATACSLGFGATCSVAHRPQQRAFRACSTSPQGTVASQISSRNGPACASSPGKAIPWPESLEENLVFEQGKDGLLHPGPWWVRSFPVQKGYATAVAFPAGNLG